MKTTQHQQLAEDLLGQIADGTFGIGDRLPTEEQLCAEYGVARGTVRQALGRLDELGLISRRPRAGTTVIASVPMAGYQPVAQSAADIVALAAETRLVKPESREVLADAALARRIGARRGTAWFLLEGVRARRGRDEAGLCWSEHYLRATSHAKISCGGGSRPMTWRPRGWSRRSPPRSSMPIWRPPSTLSPGARLWSSPGATGIGRGG